MIAVLIGKRGVGKSTLAYSLTEGRKRVIIFDPLRDELFSSFKEIDKLPEEAPHIFRWRVTCPLDKAPEFVSDICMWCYDTRDMLFIIDEADLIFPVQKPLTLGMNYMVQYGRHANVDLIVITRRPQNLNRNLTALADKMYLFRITEPRDLTYFKQTFDQETVERIQSLPQFNYLEIDNI
jgi:hypothetical protein